MKKGLAILLFALLTLSEMLAYDFSAVVPTGQTLYFSYVAGGVKVVYPADVTMPTTGWNGYTKPVGALTIPATVSNGTSSYNVVAVGRFSLYGCSGLTSVTVSEGVQRVDSSALRNCSALTTVSLPSTLTMLDYAALSQCPSLMDVWVMGATPPATGQSVFYQNTMSNCTLHVACGSYEAYSAVSPWNTFGTIQNEGCLVTVVAAANHANRGVVTGGGTYTAGTLVTLVAVPNTGYCFACWNDGDTLNPRLVNAQANCSFTAMFFQVWHDTVWLADGDTVELHDTITYFDTVYVTLPVHDTTFVIDTIHDTILPTFYRLEVMSGNPAMGVGVGSALLPAGTQVEVCGLPLEGGRFVCWNDGNADNPRQLTLTGNTSLQAVFEQVSVTGIEDFSWKVSVLGKDICVGGVAGCRVRVYDVTGRQLYDKVSWQEALTIRVSAAGAYLVRVGEGPARKIVIN